ncbi:MAG: peptide chain release factor N(5)-glutamine methyltransferase [Treponema sp.]|nr:peptide chain release factor N(5)-glutamine methyltransferase [Treponema sp.]
MEFALHSGNFSCEIYHRAEEAVKVSDTPTLTKVEPCIIVTLPTMTIRNLLKQGNALLRNHVDAPSLDARLILGHILNASHTQLLGRIDESVDREAIERFQHALNRRLDGECTAYILGYKEFWGLPFVITSAVLVPRPDTETLVSVALDFIRQRRGNSVLELCTGSGAVGISLKRERPALTVTASDVSRDALEIARQNARNLQADIRLVHGDLFERIEGCFDLIVANPPYIPTRELAALPREVQKEPRLALDGGEDGLALIRRIIASAPNHLTPQGMLLLEIDPSQTPAVRDLLTRFREVQTFRDLAGAERVIAASTAEGY